jgi:hypothetical protein
VPRLTYSDGHRKVLDEMQLKSTLYTAQNEPSWAVYATCRIMRTPEKELEWVCLNVLSHQSFPLHSSSSWRTVYNSGTFENDTETMQTCLDLLLVWIEQMKVGDENRLCQIQI